MAYAYDAYDDGSGYGDYGDEYYQSYGNESYIDNGWRGERNYRGPYPTSAAHEGYYEEYEEDSDGWEDYDESTESDDEANDDNYCDSVPEVCRRHNSRAGCPDDHCGRLHICRFFLAGNCKFDRDCRYGHSLTTLYNQEVCRDHGLSTKRATLDMLMNNVDLGRRPPDPTCHDQLEICFEAGHPTLCDGSTCNRLHLCRDYVTGTCRRRGRCRFGHDLYAGYNLEVLHRHQLESICETDILGMLCDKYSGGGGSSVPAWYNEPLPLTRPEHYSWGENQPLPAAAAPVAMQDRAGVGRGGSRDHLQVTGDRRQAAERTTTSGAAQRNGGACATTDRQCTAEQNAHGARRAATAVAGPQGASAGPRGAPAGPRGAPPSSQGATASRQGASAGSQGAAVGPRGASTNAGGAIASPRDASAGVAARTGAVGGARPRDQRGPALTDELCCPVCLELLQSATTLNCGHTLCASCVQAVREADPKCPMCRCRITSSVRSVMIDSIISRLRSSGDAGVV